MLSQKINKTFILVASIMLSHFLLLYTLKFTAWPEIFSFPYLKLAGYELYADFIHPYPPLLTTVLSILFKATSFTATPLKLFTWFFILVNDLLIFEITKKITKSQKQSLLALTFYVLTQPFLEGNMLWFDTALTTPLLFATLFHVHKNQTLAGLSLTVAIFVKQTALIYLALFALLTILSNKNKIKKLLTLFTFPILTSAIFLATLFANGNINHFINWNFLYPLIYWTGFPGYVDFSLTQNEVITVFLLSLPPAALLYKTKNILWSALYASALLAVYPRFSFFHLQPAIAISAISFGIVSKNYNKYSVPLFLSIIFLLISIPNFKFSQKIRFLEQSDYALADKISQNVTSTELFLIGPHSLNYVLAEKYPPKPWIDNFGWYFEIPSVQESLIKSFEKNPPQAVIISKPEPGQWYELGTYMPQKVLSWIKTNYTYTKNLNQTAQLWQKKN